MNLFEKMTNIREANQILEIEKAILNTKIKLEKLTEERMCKVYNGLLLNELFKNHISARFINTFDLEIPYEHLFLLIPFQKSVMGGGYILADLTFSQFGINPQFDTLLKKGYQEINEEEFHAYLNIVAGYKISFSLSLDSVYFETFKLLDENRKK